MVSPAVTSLVVGYSKTEQAKNLGNTLQLCYLEICLAVPIAITEILFGLCLQFPMKTYPNGLFDIQSGYVNSFLSCLNALSSFLAHSLNFYWYMAFSRQFRENFVTRFLRK